MVIKGEDMTDPIAFPTLAGAALTGAITFMYNRIGAVMDRRSGRVSPEQPDLVEGLPEPLVVRMHTLTPERVARLTSYAETLRHYRDGPQLLRGGDAELRQTLAGLRRELENVYDVAFEFPGDESCPTSANRPVVRVDQSADFLLGSRRGVIANGVSGSAEVHVTQRDHVIGPNAESIGVEIDGTIG
jgi:hypothetical protein